jgi:hypothetical protein
VLAVVAVAVATVLVLFLVGQDDQDDAATVRSQDDIMPSTTIASPSPTVAESPSPEEANDASRTPLDADAILAMLQEYIDLYNAGDYISASAFLSSDLEAQCGGPTDLAFALSQNHNVEQIDYGVVKVRAWGPDEPSMADVITIENYVGASYRQPLGLAFTREGGEWKLADFYPLGVGAFC